MSEVERRFHEQWLGMAQPAEGLVVSLPVLVDGQCMEKLPREAHVRFLAELVQDRGRHRIHDLSGVFEHVLELGPERFDEASAIPPEVSLYVPEGKQLLRPTRALKWPTPPDGTAGADATPAALAARPYALLVWEVPPAVESLDKPETVTGSWEYPAQAKMERLMRECRVPIGVLSNGWELRLVYAPHGESSGWIAFRVDDMASVSGRPIFDALVMLLGRQRWFGVAPERQLPALLAESRKRNADVTTELSRQVFEALEVLLAGFAAADVRDGTGLLRQAIEREDEHLYAGLLAVLLRMVFLLYCEDRALLPVEDELFAENYSLLGLFEQLQADNGKYPDTMHRRFGAYPQLVSLFRAVFLGVKHGDLEIPARRGELFDPNTYPFLEGWGPEGSAPITQPEARAAVKVPSVDDLTIYTVLHKLLYLDGQRLSYKALDVEQIGSVYEALMGFDIQRLTSGAARIKLGSKKGAARVWVEVETLLAAPKAQRTRWLQDELSFDKGVAEKIAQAVASAKDANAALVALEPLSGRRPERAPAGTLVVQPGPERRRTSSHYTPRELTEPIVARTLDPLIKAIGDDPPSETLLSLVICDPAMGSGAFLVAACRYLADHVVAAWTREGKLEVVADAHDDVVNHARRLVAQRCLYGVDKNHYAVQLARLSLWLVTMARNEPFTFVDHALRHGDSLVGLDFDQIKAFHWKPGKQVELSTKLLTEALDEAIAIRQRIQALAAEGTWAAQREKEQLLFDADDALKRVRLIGDLVIGAFFAEAKDKARQTERDRRLALVEQWLGAEKAGNAAKAGEFEAELRGLQTELRKTQVPFHWMIEFPEVFYAERADPLDGWRRNGAAWIDGFVGNPPFMGGKQVAGKFGNEYRDWLLELHDGSHGNGDLCAHFFRRSAALVGCNGTFGLIATNTISQGDTRITGLDELLRSGVRLYAAQESYTWPGDAAVIVSIVHGARGTVARERQAVLDGRLVASINSSLKADAQRSGPERLRHNDGLFSAGSFICGAGFLLEPAERNRLVEDEPSNQQRVRPYIGGEEVNNSAEHAFSRYVISFDAMPLEAASAWPSLLDIVRLRVKPGRDILRDDNASARTLKKQWWRFQAHRPALYAALASLSRCIVASQVTKHLVFAFQPTDRIFAHTLNVFPFAAASSFAVLQSRIHEPWARLLSSSMKTDLRYAASDCFETFPFPQPDPRSVIRELEAIGERLYETRARYMVDTDQGLTKTYNALKDPGCTDPRILELRQLHEDMDRAVLVAYGWSDLDVPPYCPRTDAERTALKAFEDAVIDRLFELNAKRAAEERAAQGDTQPAKRKTTKQPKRAGKTRKVEDPVAAQPGLPGMDASDG